MHSFYAPAVAAMLMAMSMTTLPAKASAAAKTAMLPDRYLECVLSRSTNVDREVVKTTTDIVSEGRFPLALRLPPRLAHTGPDPDPSEAPKPVDARTRIISDPAGLTRTVAPSFARVEDLWPRRVELVAAIDQSTWIQFIAISAIDVAKGTAHLFMAPVKDAATMDLKKVYQGECTVTNQPVRMSRR